MCLICTKTFRSLHHLTNHHSKFHTQAKKRGHPRGSTSAAKVADVPSSSKVHEIPVMVPRDEIPVMVPRDEIPVMVPRDEIPVMVPRDEIPAMVPREQIQQRDTDDDVPLYSC